MKPFILSTFLAFAACAQTPVAEYQLAPNFPKYATAHVELRDSGGVRWPSLFYGKPQTNGFIRLGPAPAASIAINCDQRPQASGDQSRRVLGELFSTSSKGGIILRIQGVGPLKSRTEMQKPLLETTLAGSMEVAGKHLPFNAPARLVQHPGGRGDEKNEALFVTLEFDLKAGDLELKTMPAGAPLHLRATLTAYAPSAAAARRRPPQISKP